MIGFTVFLMHLFAAIVGWFTIFMQVRERFGWRAWLVTIVGVNLLTVVGVLCAGAAG